MKAVQAGRTATSIPWANRSLASMVYFMNAPLRSVSSRLSNLKAYRKKGHVCLETTKLEILPGDRTRVVIQDLFQSVSDRDGAVASGMETGIRESYERVDELLGKALIQ